MGLIFNNGQLLFVAPNVLAMSTACCCGGGDCCGRQLPVGPTPRHMPEFLTVTIEAIEDCTCSDGQTFQMQWSTINQYWEAFPDLGIPDCGLLNSGTHWILNCGPTATQFRLQHLGVCAGIDGTPLQGTCNPLFLLFEFEIGGVGCCDGTLLGGTATIRIRISE